jgi:hypothetical protein
MGSSCLAYPADVESLVLDALAIVRIGDMNDAVAGLWRRSSCGESTDFKEPRTTQSHALQHASMQPTNCFRVLTCKTDG